MDNQDEDPSDQAVRYLLKGAERLQACAELALEDADDEVESWFRHHANTIRDLAELIKPSDQWPGNVVPFMPKSAPLKALPPDRGRRES